MIHPAIRRYLLPMIIVGSMSTPAAAVVYYDFTVSNAPPAARYEVVPARRHGYVWAPGYWNWDRGRHQWVSGHWVEERPGYVWVGERWERKGKHWRLSQGHWKDDPYWDHNRGWDKRQDVSRRDRDWDDRGRYDNHTTHQSWDPDRRWGHQRNRF